MENISYIKIKVLLMTAIKRRQRGVSAFLVKKLNATRLVVFRIFQFVLGVIDTRPRILRPTRLTAS